MSSADTSERLASAARFAILHRRWTVPLAWLVLVGAFLGGAAWWGGFDSEALPWIGGVLGLIVAGVLGGLVCVAKSLRMGWPALFAWLLLPVFHFGSVALNTSEGWAPTFFADIVAILLTIAIEVGAVAASFRPARPGSFWDRTLSPEGRETGRASVTQLNARARAGTSATDTKARSRSVR